MTTIDMTIRELLFWVVLGGSIGGLTAVLIRVKLANHGLLLEEISVRSRSLLYLAVCSLLIGSAAALAFQWVLISVGKFRSNTQLEDIVFILATSVAAGYVARWIFPMITSQSEELISKVESVNKKVKHVEDDMKATSLLTRAFLSPRPGAPRSEMQANRNNLDSYLKSHPTDRRTAITLASIYRANEDLGCAIAVLDLFLKAKADLQQFDKDYADALYNRACYKLLVSASTGDVGFKDQAYEDLKKSIEISPPKTVDAQSDEDLKPLWQEERFKTLVETFRPTVTELLSRE